VRAPYAWSGGEFAIENFSLGIQPILHGTPIATPSLNIQLIGAKADPRMQVLEDRFPSL
jgi:hypothetical protein